jgi:hypothetical protein
MRRLGDLSLVKTPMSEETVMSAAGTIHQSSRARVVRCLTTATTAALLAGALPAVAGATDYCVNTSCGGQSVQSFENAIDLADNADDADRIFLGAGTYSGKFAFYYFGPNSRVEIIGQGAGQTVLTRSAPDDDEVLRLIAGPGSSVHDLTIRLPQGMQAGFGGLATKNAARRIEVIDEDPTQVIDRYGVELFDGGTLEDSSVRLSHLQDTTAVSFGVGGGAVRRSTLSARTGVYSYGGTIERSRITGETGVLGDGNVTAISGSLIRVSAVSGCGCGVLALARAGTHTKVNADGITIVGPGGVPNTYGAAVATEPALAYSADLNLTNAIIRGVSSSLFAAAGGGTTGQAKLAVSYSDYDPSGNDAISANASIAEANVSNAGDAGFVDAAGGDYHLLPSSPLLDAGDPATAQGLDLDDNPLVADGDGDGVARRDLGASELQLAPAGGGDAGGGGGGGQQGGPPPGDTVAPVVSGFRAAPALFAVTRASTPLAARVSRGTRFRYTLSEAARVTLKIQRALPGRRARYRTLRTLKRSGAKGANRIRFSGRLGRRALRRGRYRAVIRAVDGAGNRSAPRTARFRVAGS